MPATVVFERTSHKRYMARPIQVGNPACLGCHSTPDAAPATMVKLYGSANGFGWKLNEIVGAQIVSVPMTLPLENAQRAFYTFMGSLLVVFALVFVALNGGVAIGDAASHPLGIYDQNLLFFLVLVSIVLGPLLVLCAAETWRMVSRRPALWGSIALVLAAWFQLGWHVDHPYNLLPYHLHNDVAVWLNTPGVAAALEHPGWAAAVAFLLVLPVLWNVPRLVPEQGAPRAVWRTRHRETA